MVSIPKRDILERALKITWCHGTATTCRKTEKKSKVHPAPSSCFQVEEGKQTPPPEGGPGGSSEKRWTVPPTGQTHSSL